MKTHYFKVTADERFITQEELISRLTAPGKKEAEPTQVAVLPCLTNKEVAQLALDTSLDNCFDGKPSENYAFGFLDGYKTARGGGEE